MSLVGWSSLAHAIAEKSVVLPSPSDAFFSSFNTNENYEQRFYSNSYELNRGFGYGQQFEEMASAR